MYDESMEEERQMSKEESVAWQARGPVAFLIAVLEILREEAPSKTKASVSQEELEALRALVGIANFDQLVRDSKALLKRLRHRNFKVVHPHLGYSFKESAEMLVNWDNNPEYAQLYTDSLIFDPSDYPITAKELRSAKANLLSHERFARTVIGYIDNADEEMNKALDENTRCSRKKLKKMLWSGNIRLSELRLLLLVLRLVTEYKLEPVE